MAIGTVFKTEVEYFSATPVTSVNIPDLDLSSLSNGGLFVSVAVLQGNANVSDVKWNSVSIDIPLDDGGTSAPFAEWWTELSPTAVQADVDVTFSAGVNGYHIVVVWFSSDNALALSANNDFLRNDDDPNTITYVADSTIERILSSYATDDNAVATGNETLLEQYDSGGNCGGAQYKDTVASGNHTITWDRGSGQGAVLHHTCISVYEAISNDPPTVVLDTADDTEFTDDTPTVLFTGTDPDGDGVRYNVQISDNPNFTAGVEETDAHETGTNFTIHMQPLGSTSWDGFPQTDDAPGQSYIGGGGELDSIELLCGVDEDPATDVDGTAYVYFYEHEGEYGTSSAPLNAADPGDTPTPDWIAESAGVVFSGAATFDWRTFSFSGANRIRLERGKHYIFCVRYKANNSLESNNIAFRADSAAGHGGNLYLDGASVVNNGVHDEWDLYFRVNEEFTVLLDKVSGTDAGFSGVGSEPYDSGEQASYTVQAGDALDDAVYSWKVRAIDPAGSNAYGAFATTREFTVNTAGGSAIGLISETETLLGVSGLKERAAGLVTETETPLAVTGLKEREADLVSETETLFPMSGGKVREIGLIVETESLQAVVGSKSQEIGQVVETETVQGVTGLKSREVGLVSEMESLFSFAGLKVGVLGLISETETVFPMSSPGGIVMEIGLIVETETLLSMSGLKVRTIGQVAESEQLLAMTPVKSREIGLISEMESLFGLAGSKVGMVGLMSETETLFSVSVPLTVIIAAYGLVRSPRKTGSVESPANSALVIVLINTTEADATLQDLDSLQAVLANVNTVELGNTGYARIVLTDAEITAPSAQDDANNRLDLDLDDFAWGAITDDDVDITDVLVCYDPDTTGGDDSTIIPIDQFDFPISVDGTSVTTQLNAAGFHRFS